MVDDVGGRVDTRRGVLFENLSDLNEVAQFGFLFDDFGMCDGVNVRESGGINRLEVSEADIFRLVGLAQFFENRQDVWRNISFVQVQNDSVNDSVFGAVKVFGGNNGVDFGHDFAVFDH